VEGRPHRPRVVGSQGPNVHPMHVLAAAGDAKSIRLALESGVDKDLALQVRRPASCAWSEL
jgi:hypothetical protein